MYKVAILTMLLALATTKAGAQYDAYFSHYFDMMPSFNPATVGKEDKLNITAAYSMAMVGFDNAPKTLYAAGDMPFAFLNSIHGVGLQLLSDKIGLFDHQFIKAQYALRENLGGGWFSVGLQGGLLNESFRGSEVELENESDPAFSKSDIKGSAFDLGVGLYYSRKNWYAGISAQHLTSPTIELGERNEIKVDATLYATGGMTFQLNNPYIKVATSARVMSDLVAYRADITGRLLYTYNGRMLYGGFTYSPTNSVTMLLGGKFQGIVVGYSYEAYTNGISMKNGSHELFVGYQTDIDLGKKGKNRHQTTRTL